MRKGFFLNANDWLTSVNILTMTPAEEGAYIRLLCYAWRDEKCSLPVDDESLSIISRLGSEWGKSRGKLLGNFKKKGGRYINERLLFEHERYLAYLESQSMNGKKGGRPRKNKQIETDGKAMEKPNESETKAKLNPKKGNSNSNSNKEEDKVVNSTSLPPCPHSEIIDLYAKHLPSLQQVSKVKDNGDLRYNWKGQRMRNLAARWKEDQRRQELVWWQGLVEYIGGVPFLMGENARGWSLTLGWLVKAENFNKVIEGNYDV